MLDFTHDSRENTLEFTFSGRLDTLASNVLAAEIGEKVLRAKGSEDPEVLFPGRIVFNFEKVDFVSSAFLRICVGTAKSAESGHFSIRNCSPMLKKTFKIAGLDEVFNIQ